MTTEQTAFAVLIKLNGLEHINENIFEVDGIRYYADSFGFHTAEQRSNAQLEKSWKELEHTKEVLETLIKKYENSIKSGSPISGKTVKLKEKLNL